MKSKKEITSLIALAKLVGQEPDADLLEELQQLEQQEQAEQNFRQKIINETIQSIQEDIQDIFGQMEHITEEVTTQIEKKKSEQPETPKPVQEENLIDKTIQQISKAEKIQKESVSPFTAPPAPKVAPELAAVTRKIKYLEEWLQKIAVAGPAGGGAGEIYNLDMPTMLVTGDYTIGRKDYYIGVNADVKTYITLPTSGVNLKNGREVVIKDESGHAQLTPIKIIGTIDNDPNGAEIRINNGSVTLLYRDGWRII